MTLTECMDRLNDCINVAQTDVVYVGLQCSLDTAESLCYKYSKEGEHLIVYDVDGGNVMVRWGRYGD